jgi:hypothetical protein
MDKIIKICINDCADNGTSLCNSATSMMSGDLAIIAHLLQMMNKKESNEARCLLCAQCSSIAQISEPSQIK